MTELLKLNNRLHLFQNKIIKEAKKLDSELIKRVEDENDELEDYEIDLELSLYLKEDDKEYKEDDDNIIMTLNDYVKGISDKECDYPWDDTNHNEFHIRNNPHNMKDEHHCWFYHCLYDHTELTWDDMLRIGSFWMDIHVHYQYSDNIYR